jgi:hypothetical protein
MEKYFGNSEVSFSRQVKVGACAGGEKREIFGSGAGFLFVETRPGAPVAQNHCPLHPAGL